MEPPTLCFPVEFNRRPQHCDAAGMNEEEVTSVSREKPLIVNKRGTRSTAYLVHDMYTQQYTQQYTLDH